MCGGRIIIILRKSTTITLYLQNRAAHIPDDQRQKIFKKNVINIFCFKFNLAQLNRA